MNIEDVDLKSIALDGVDMRDYPDFCDAYIEEASFKNGTFLNDTELEELQDLVDMNELAMDRVF